MKHNIYNKEHKSELNKQNNKNSDILKYQENETIKFKQ